MTLDEAKTMTWRDEVHHRTEKNSDGSALRARCNGKPKTWKRSPDRVQVPMKHGLRNCFYICETDLEEWTLGHEGATA